jgi:hypothetical protein
MVVKKVYEDFGASIMELLGALFLGGLVFIFFRLLGLVVIGTILFPIIVTVGIFAVSIRSFRPGKDSPYHFIFNMMFIIMITLIFFAAVYHLMPHTPNDYLAVHDTPKMLSFSDALYYSTVTITTLGYGDVVPHGFFRAFAATEALLGFIFLGLFVSGLTLFFSAKRK